MDGISVSAVVLAAAKAIPGALLKHGPELLRQEPIRRAIAAVESDFASAFHGELGEAFRAWLTDEAVRAAVQEVKSGGASSDATDFLVTKFQEHASVPGLSTEAATRFVRQFLQRLEEEASQEKTGLWRFQNVMERLIQEGTAETAAGLAELSGQMTTSFWEIQQQLAALAPSTPDESESGDEWHRRIDDANALLKEGKVRSALARYEQLLEQVKSETVPPRVLYRLHTNIGSSLIAMSEWNKARPHFARALDLQPNDSLALSQMAQVELHAEQIEQALVYANRVIDAEPHHHTAWMVKVQSDPNLDWDSVPAKVEESPDYWLARANEAFKSSDLGETERLAREALRRSSRTPHELIGIAEMLHVSYAVRPPSPIPAETRDDVDRLITEALADLDEDEHKSLASRAFTIRGVTRLSTNPERAVADLRRAIELRPVSVTARLGLAQALLAVNETDGAFYELRQIPKEEADARVHALMARAMVMTGRPAHEVEVVLLEGIESVRSGLERAAVLYDLAETATRGGNLAVAVRILDEIQDPSHGYLPHVLRARVAASREDEQDAIAAYEAALGESDGEARNEVQLEFAGFLASRGHSSAAASRFREADALHSEDWIRAQYAKALTQASRWEELEELLAVMRGEGPLDGWALDVASMLALNRDDLPTARAYLEELIARDVPRPQVSIRLAYALLRMGHDDEAVGALDALVAEPELTGNELRSVAQLYFQAGRYDDSLNIAYRALRIAPGDARVETTFAAIFFQTPEGIQSKRDPDVVGPDTWVRLQSARSGSEATFLLTAGAPLLGRQDELQFDSDAAALLVGRRVGDAVTLQPNAIDPEEYRVCELHTAIVHAAKSIAGRIHTQIGAQDLALQAVHIGEPQSVRYLAPVIGVLFRSEAARKNALIYYHSHSLPLGFLAGSQGSSLRQAYLRLVSGTEGALLVEPGSGESMHEAAVSAETSQAVIVATSALLTLQAIGCLEVLPRLYGELLMPPSAVDEVRRELQELELDAERGPVRRMAPGPTGVELHEVPADVVNRELNQLHELLSFITNHVTLIPRPLGPEDDQQEALREVIGDSSVDTYLNASGTRPLYADDAGLRRLAKDTCKAPSFSTFAFLDAAAKKGLITAQDRLANTMELIRLQHAFVPISADLLMAALRQDGFSLGPRVRSALARLTPPLADVGSSVPVAALFIREIARSVLAGGALRGVVWTVLDTFLAGDASGGTLKALDRMVNGALTLLPIAQAEYAGERSAFLRARGLRL